MLVDFPRQSNRVGSSTTEMDALKAQNPSAQGNALGQRFQKTNSPSSRRGAGGESQREEGRPRNAPPHLFLAPVRAPSLFVDPLLPPAHLWMYYEMKDGMWKTRVPCKGAKRD